MIVQLQQQGFTKNYFPFDKHELEKLHAVASEASKLVPNDRKNIFHHFPVVQGLFERAVHQSVFDLELTDYCFFIEKTDERNWPLLYHKDINLPEYMDICDSIKEDYLKKAVMFRLTLDISDEDTGAIKVIPGSHIDRYGEEEFVNTEAGEVIFFKPLLLHGSNKMKKPHKRRVFQALCIEK